jgi:hypothetical protein
MSIELGEDASASISPGVTPADTTPHCLHPTARTPCILHTHTVAWIVAWMWRW